MIIGRKCHITGDSSRAGVFNFYLLRGHILMAERFMGCIHILQRKVCILLQDMPANISVHKHTQNSFVILFIYLWFMIYFSYYLLNPTSIFLEKECRSYANSEGSRFNEKKRYIFKS
jgi:hypothetical protein